MNFGSFGVDFRVTTSYVSGPASDKSSTSLFEISWGIEESIDKQASKFAMIDSERNVERKRFKYNSFFGFRDRFKIRDN